MSDMLKIFKNGNMQSNNCIIYNKLSSSSSVCIVFFWQDTVIPVKPHNKFSRHCMIMIMIHSTALMDQQR